MKINYSSLFNFENNFFSKKTNFPKDNFCRDLFTLLDKKLSHFPEDFNNAYTDWATTEVWPGEGPRYKWGSATVVTFNVTEDCQLRCSYCYQTSKNDKHKMSFETAKSAIDRIFEESEKNSPESRFNEEKCHAIVLDFIGGEPLLEIELIDQICEYFLLSAVKRNHRWQTHFIISMTSNGYDYFKPEVQDFINKYKERLNINITLDGNKELHDTCRRTKEGEPTFDRAFAAHLDAVKRELTNSTKMTFSPNNVKYLFEAIKFLIEKCKVDSIPANPIFEIEWKPKHAREYYYQLKKLAEWLVESDNYDKFQNMFFDLTVGVPLTDERGELCDENDANPCGSTSVMTAIGIDGKLYPCMRFIPFSISNKEREDFYIGNIEKGLGYDEITKDRINFLKSITLSSQSTEECINCPIASHCGWCTAWNYDYYGTPNKRFTGICNTHIARSLANLVYYNLIFKKLKLPFRLKNYIPEEMALRIIEEEEWNYIKSLSKI